MRQKVTESESTSSLYKGENSSDFCKLLYIMLPTL